MLLSPRLPRRVTSFGLVAVLLTGCSGGGDAPRRTIEIIADNQACTPARIEVKAGERVAFEVKNQASGDREFEGVDGTKIEEVLIPAGRTRTIPYTVQESSTPLKVKCYIPAGPTTLIELAVTGKAASGGGQADEKGDESPFKTSKAPQATVTVHMDSFVMKPDMMSVSAGPIRFMAMNDHASEVHELAVLRLKEDGSYQNAGEVEDVAPKRSGSITLDLPKGKYVLACLITPGEAGSKTDHFKSGMRVDFEVR